MSEDRFESPADCSDGAHQKTKKQKVESLKVVDNKMFPCCLCTKTFHQLKFLIAHMQEHLADEEPQENDSIETSDNACKSSLPDDSEYGTNRRQTSNNSCKNNLTEVSTTDIGNSESICVYHEGRLVHTNLPAGVVAIGNDVHDSSMDGREYLTSDSMQGLTSSERCEPGSDNSLVTLCNENSSVDVDDVREDIISKVNYKKQISQIPVSRRVSTRKKYKVRYSGFKSGVVKGLSYECSVCGYECLNRGKLVEHMKQHPVGDSESQSEYHKDQKKSGKCDKRKTCLTCGKTYATNSILNRHMKEHAGVMYTCDICGKIFSRSDTLNNHRGNHRCKPYKGLDLVCPICKNVFSTRNSLIRHSRLHPKTAYTCDKCSLSFSTEDDLKDHLKNSKCRRSKSSSKSTDSKSGKQHDRKDELQQNQIVDYNEATKIKTKEPREKKCKYCGKQFIDIYNLRMHVKCHEKGFPVCTQCGKTYSSERKLKQHVKVVHQGIKNSVCNVCGKAFCDFFALKLHMLTHEDRSNRHKFTCETCGKDFLKMFNLKNHQEVVHGTETFPCHVCGKVFRCEKYVLTHEKFHTVPLMDRKFPCNICSFRAFSMAQLRRHQKYHDPGLRHKCDVCGRAYKTKYGLSDHKKVHSDKFSNFQCNLCNKAYSTQTNLNRHKLSHSGKKPHICEFCGKCFSIGYYLENHMKIHGGGHVCHECGKSFPNESGLTRHQTSDEDQKIYSCMKCDRVFNWPMCLRNHLIKHAGDEFKCRECGKKYASKLALKHHQNKYHLEVKNVWCSKCGGDFKSFFLMEQHICPNVTIVNYKEEQILTPTNEVQQALSNITDEVKQHIIWNEDEQGQEQCVNNEEQVDIKYILYS